MVKERTCILCHSTHASKKEMDEHMRSMLHHRELENLKGRDCQHECRVCGVTVVGLSAYAKHISTALHKESAAAPAKDKDPGDGREEQYFDKELIQLIRQRKEPKREDISTPVDRETDGGDRRHRWRWEERPINNYTKGSWHHSNLGDQQWNWEGEDYMNCRLGDYQRSHWKSNSGATGKWHQSGARGAGGWQAHGSGGAPDWYGVRSVRGGFPNWHARGCSTWHFTAQGRGRNWSETTAEETYPTYPNTEESYPTYPKTWANYSGPAEEPGALWSNGKPRKLSKKDRARIAKERRAWEKIWKRNEKLGKGATKQQQESMTQWPESEGPHNFSMDFTDDYLPNEGMLNFNVGDCFSKEDPSGGKSSSPSRDKSHRWAPYQAPKSTEPPASTKDSSTKGKHGDSDATRCLSMKQKNLKGPHEANKELGVCTTAAPQPSNPPTKAGTRTECQTATQCAKIRPPLLPTPNIPPIVLKAECRNIPKKGNPSSITKEQTPLSTLDLETSRGLSEPEVSVHRPDHATSTPSSQLSVRASTSPIVTPHKPLLALGGEAEESLSEVLRRAKEVLRCSQTERRQQAEQMDAARSQPDQPVGSPRPASQGSEESGKEKRSQPGAAVDCKEEETSEKELVDCTRTGEGTVAGVDSAGCLGEVLESSNPAAEQGAASDHVTSSRLSPGVVVSNRSPGDDGHPPSRSSFSGAEMSDGEAQHWEASDHSDSELPPGATQGSSHLLNKLGLPSALQRDLTRHMTAKCRAGPHVPEPNLNSARRIRSSGSQRRSESEKESGLKPTLKQLLNVSRRHVNWDQVIQQVAKKKQELGKGLPRFGIEMVPSVQTGQDSLDLDEDEKPGSLEGFHWEGISVTPGGSLRKRSLSESSVVTDKTSVYSLFVDAPKATRRVQSGASGHQPAGRQQPPSPLGPKAGNDQNTKEGSVCGRASCPVQCNQPDSRATPDHTSLTSTQQLLPVKSEQDVELPGERNSAQAGKQDAGERNRELQVATPTGLGAVPGSVAADGATDSSYTSGGELNDTQAMGKKRRAGVDLPSPEVSGLERKNKRRKLKSKKERSQVDQLLSMSLREEELNRSLHGLDGSLLQARTTLQSAYLEVQRLLVVKQQITIEMSSLRTRRISILQGLQETYDPTGLSAQHPGCSAATTNTSADLGSKTKAPLIPNRDSPNTATPVPQSTPPYHPGAAIPDSSIKQEPSSPAKDEAMTLSRPEGPGGHVTTTLGQAHHTAQASDGVEQPSSPFPIISLPPLLQQLAELPALSCDKLSVGMAVGSAGSKLSGSSVLPSPAHAPSPAMAHAPSLADRGHLLAVCKRPGLPLAGSPSTLQKCSGKELRAGGEQLDPENPGNKRKKKFRKKKCARVAQEPENSDTEQDSHVAQPVRKSRNSKKPSKPKVSTSSWQGPEGSSVAREQREMADCDFSLEVVEVAKPQLEVVAVDSLESGDDKPESLAQQQQPGHGLGTPETPTNAGYNEVSSTSEMGTSFTDDIERSVAETQTTVSSLLKSSKNTSEVSSEAGDDEEGPTEGAFEGHQGAVNDVQIHNGHLYTCSADKTVRVYDLVSRQCVGTFEGHSTKVNCLLIVQTHGTFARLYTGSSDQIIRCYNVESRECVEQFVLSDRVLSLHNRWRMLYAGLANGSVITFSVKSNRQLDVFECHGPRAVSCLSSAQEGSRRLLLVGSYDCTISVRDAKNGLLLRTLEGHTKTVLCMKVVNDLVFSGSSDHSVHAHNIHTGELVRIYKGHSHAVTVVSILGKVMVTACLDKMVRVYELNSHDRLQVYGGHKDMVMCMTIHKSMIYTGCYDGSVQAVRLNLMQNFRCWWQGCCLIFGVREHLRQHLLAEHSGPSLQNLKCRWRNCNAFFTVKQRTKQNVPNHLSQHAEENRQQVP
eukprot:gi/632975445/ref/XP_007904233.1/ PREDICTED: zinc finger protein 106 [Callorhinchus milii]